MKELFRVLFLFTLLSVLISCSKESTQLANSQTAPKFYDESTIAQYTELTNAGYNLLADGNADSAVASFLAAGQVIPDAKSIDYDIACVYGRIGDRDKAFDYLQKVVDKGWDIPDQLLEDTDLAPLADDPRFDDIFAKAEQNQEENQAFLVNGIPELASAPMTFQTEEELNNYLDSLSAPLRKHRSIWYGSQYLQAIVDYRAKKLACLKEFHKNDKDYEYQYVRLSEICKVKSPYECWGSLSHAVVNECDSYLAGNPSDTGQPFANFYAGFAYANQNCDVDDLEREALLEKSNNYLMNIPETANLYGPAKTLMLANKLDMNDGDKEQYRNEVRETLSSYSGNKWVNRIVSTRFFDDAIQILWPIELGIADIDNKVVKLDDYKGKVLLIDFWATWCGPCLAELPNIKNVYNEYHSKGFDIVSISLDYEGRKPLDAYREWITENEMPWRHIYEGTGWDVSLVQKYFVSGIPAPFLIGKDGQILAQGEECAGSKLAETVENALTM